VEPPSTSVLKTYAQDFRERMKQTQASQVTVLAAEQDMAPRTPIALAEKPSHANLIYGIAGGVLLIAGAVGAYFAYTYYLGASAPVVVAPTIVAPIFVDEKAQVSGSGPQLIQAIAQSVANPIARGAVRLLYLDTTTTSSVFSALGLPAPGGLTRNISAAQSMAGVVNVDGRQSPFFILSVTYYGETFAGMLQWEPFMPRDLAKLFPSYPAPVANTPAVATTTATTTPKSQTSATTTKSSTLPAPVSAAFYDMTIANHDARVYRDSLGRDILVYGYWDQKTLVIARDAAAFTEILARLATSHTTP
jgi:hypothetical protein